MIGDVHIRRNDFIQDPSFYLLRGAANYWGSENLTLALGYAHNWIAPAEEDWGTWTEENRIYQQIQYGDRKKKLLLLHRLRNEQRWKQEVEDDVLTGEIEFTDRIRYLGSLIIALSERPSVPALLVADEIHIQFGPEVVANTFDQNRLFAGIKQSLGQGWSFDLGYMMVYQQQASGFEYNLNHTLRWFFYWTPDWRKPGPAPIDPLRPR